MRAAIKWFVILAVLVFPPATMAQNSGLRLDTQVNFIPNFSVNSDHYTSMGSQGIRLFASNLNKFPVELGMHVFRGYGSSVDISYGLSLAYMFVEGYTYRFKIGMSASRFFLNDYKRENEEVGDVTEDDLPTSFKPYLEWEWNFSNTFGLFVQTGYRLMISQTETVTEILRFDDGTVQAALKDEERHIYDSGFEVGAGFSINF